MLVEQKTAPSFTIFNARDTADVPLQEVRDRLFLDTFVCVRGLFSPDEIRAARERMRNRFNAKDDRKHDPKDADALLANFQKGLLDELRASTALRACSGCFTIPCSPRIFSGFMRSFSA